MRVDLFDYELPEERIAQRPLADRSKSRLLVLDRQSGERTHAAFADLGDFLPPRSLLVLNDTAVLPARILGRKADTGGRVEILLLQRAGAALDPLRAPDAGEPSWGRWTALVTASKKIRPGLKVELAGGATATVEAPAEDDPSGGAFRVALEGDGPIGEGLASVGAPPLPPYIRRDEGPDAEDADRYQTVFARSPGAVAAPTAGLHFTPAILDALAAAGHEIAHVTLHVGAGTFLPVRVEDTGAHRMHAERFRIPEATAAAIARARSGSHSTVAVGTTSLRALETASRDGGVAAGEGVSDLFITPGFRFRVVDHLLTNFHQPRSTLMMLVAAFAGLEAIHETYREAIAREYRFLSYGDAMLIL